MEDALLYLLLQQCCSQTDSSYVTEVQTPSACSLCSWVCTAAPHAGVLSGQSVDACNLSDIPMLMVPWTSFPLHFTTLLMSVCKSLSSHAAEEAVDGIMEAISPTEVPPVSGLGCNTWIPC